MTVGLDLTTCRSCGASIFWARTEKNAAIPLDVIPRHDGNLYLLPAFFPDKRRRVRRAHPTDDPEARYVSHFATCPQASEWRKAQ